MGEVSYGCLREKHNDCTGEWTRGEECTCPCHGEEPCHNNQDPILPSWDLVLAAGLPEASLLLDA